MTKEYNNFPISAIIVCINEIAHLEESLLSVALSDELLMYDMGSTDGSIEIAREIVTEVRHIPRVDIVEKVWKRVVSEAKHDWIILLDPDEVFPASIFPELEKIINTQQNVGLISIPWKFYFLGKPLNSTQWGKDKFKARIFNRNCVEITGLIFDGIKIKSEYKRYTFPQNSGYIIQHFWIDNIPQLFSKHWRYIKHDGKARFEKGQRFNLIKQFTDSSNTLWKDLTDFKGFKDGLRGIFLSFFHAWFIFMCHISLGYYQIFKARKLNAN